MESKQFTVGAQTPLRLAKTQISLRFHYENTPIQMYRKFHLQKLKIFR